MLHLEIFECANGWILNSASTGYADNTFSERARIFVFANLDELFAWMRERAEGEKKIKED